MRHPVLFLLIFFHCVSSANGQQPASGTTPLANPYIEGARLVIDILQLFKRDNGRRTGSSGSGKGILCNFCIYNSDSLQKIKVVLASRVVQGAAAHTLVIKPGQQECSLQIPCGIYNCRVESADEKVISWGDIHVNEQEVFIRR